MAVESLAAARLRTCDGILADHFGLGGGHTRFNGQRKIHRKLIQHETIVAQSQKRNSPILGLDVCYELSCDSVLTFSLFLDLLFGMPSLQARKFESRLQEERSRYLVAELLCSVTQPFPFVDLC